MDEKTNHLKAAELSTEQSYTMIDGILNNAPIQPEEKRRPKERVKRPEEQQRGWELER